MSKRSEQIASLLKSFNENSMPVFVGKVTSAVDEENLTVDVEPVGQAELSEVRLKAAIDGVTDGVVEYPKINSTVLCGIIGDDEDICFIVKCSEVDQVVITGEVAINGNVVINGGENGKLINVESLVTQLEKNSARIDGIIDAIKNAKYLANDGGMTLQLNIGLALDLLIDVEDYSDITDDKVTH